MRTTALSHNAAPKRNKERSQGKVRKRNQSQKKKFGDPTARHVSKQTWKCEKNHVNNDNWKERQALQPNQ